MKKKIKIIIYMHLWIMVVTPVIICLLIGKVFDISDDDIKCAPKSLQTFVDRLSKLLDCWIN